MLATEFLADLVRRLESRDVTYALVGSIATMSYGEPRATLDIDVVVALNVSGLDTMEALFPFNVIHPASGMKVDFFLAGDDIERSQIERRLRRTLLAGVDAWCSPPEELVVKRLLYYHQGASDKHLRDVASMFRISPEGIDLGRVRELASQNDVGELLDHVMASVRED